MGEGNAELGFRCASGDLGVGLGIDIGIDAQGDGRALARRQRHLAQRQQFRLAFDIELIDAGIQRGAHLFAGLADARENDLARRNSRRQRLRQLAARHNVGAGAQLGQRLEHRQVAIGLDRIGDQRALGQRFGKDFVVPLQRGAGIAIERRADLFGQRVQPHAFRAQHAILVLEKIHLAYSIQGRSGSRLTP